jgi:hypothetical protein
MFSERLKTVRSFQLFVLADSDKKALEAKMSIKTMKMPHLILRVGRMVLCSSLLGKLKEDKTAIIKTAGNIHGDLKKRKVIIVEKRVSKRE